MRAPVLLLATFLAACGSSGDRAGAEFNADLGIDTARLTTTASGLRYQDLSSGEGSEASPGATALVHYTGWLTDGQKFDSSRDRNEPFAFRLGAGQVIAGWDEGVAGMRVGGRRKLVIPAGLGYGQGGAPPVIPPGATLVFEVELLAIQ